MGEKLFGMQALARIFAAAASINYFTFNTELTTHLVDKDIIHIFVLISLLYVISSEIPKH